MGLEHDYWLVALCGEEGSCKTTMALTFPKPLSHLDIDVGGYRRAAWRLDISEVESHSFPKPLTDADIAKMKGITDANPKASTRTLAIPKKIEGMKELWQNIIDQIVKDALNPGMRSIVIDSATLHYKIGCDAYLQELQEKQIWKWKTDPRTRNIPFDENDYREKLQPIEYGCLHPDTKVLISDLTWRKISEVSVGDELIGFDEETENKGRGSIKKFRRSVVEGVSRTIRPTFIICLSDDSYIIASDNHQWLTTNHFDFPSGDFIRSEWKTTDKLKPGSTIRYMGKPWEYDTSRDAGYLEGVYDGEGWIDKYGVGFKQNTGSVLDKTISILDSKHFLHTRFNEEESEKTSSDSASIRIGHLNEDLRFLGSIRPKRLLQSANKLWEGKALRKLPEVSVTAILPLGTTELVDIQTSTRTFIAEGLLTHNSVYDRLQRIYHTCRSYRKNLILIHYPTDEYGAIMNARGEMTEGKTGKIIMDGYKDTAKFADLVMWLSVKSKVDKGVETRYPVAKFTKCGLVGMGMSAVGMEVAATYEGIANLKNLMSGGSDA